MIDPITAYVLAIVFAATLIRSSLGFGEALFAVPLLALKIPIATAAPLAVLVSITVSFFVVIQDWRHIHVKSAGGLLLATIFGTPVGLWLLKVTNERPIKLGLAGLLFAFGLYSLAAGAKLHLKRDHKRALLGAGFVAGILGGLYGMNGPPLVIYGALRRWSPQHFRATLQAYFLPASLLTMIGYLLAGFWNREVTFLFAASLPLILVAMLLGRVINRRLAGDGFFKLLYVALMAIGVLLAVQSV
jgi:uncharacterized membrane protein YfcA